MRDVQVGQCLVLERAARDGYGLWVAAQVVHDGQNAQHGSWSLLGEHRRINSSRIDLRHQFAHAIDLRAASRVTHAGVSMQGRMDGARTTRLRKRRFSMSAPPRYMYCASNPGCSTQRAMSLIVMGTGERRMNSVAASSGVNAPSSSTRSDTS